MSNNNYTNNSNGNSTNNSSNNRINVPEAREGMNQFKMQAANDLGVSVTY